MALGFLWESPGIRLAKADLLAYSQMMGAGLDLIRACLTVSLFNLAVCLSHGTLLLASLPMDETFSAAAILQLHIWLSEERPVSGVRLTCMDMI